MKAENTNFHVATGKQHQVLLFQPSMEAFIIANYDNNKTRWEARATYYHKAKNWSATLPPRKKGKDADGNPVPDPLYDGKYSSSTKGNIPFGSWNSDGLKFFNACMKEIKDARADKDSMAKMEAFEVTFRKYLQDKYNKVGAEHGKKKGKKRKAGEDQEAAEAAGIDIMEEIADDMFV